MAASKDNIIRKHNKIRQRYKDLKAIRDKGVQKYSIPYIIATIAEEFFLSPATIENIVWTTATKSNDE